MSTNYSTLLKDTRISRIFWPIHKILQLNIFKNGKGYQANELRDFYACRLRCRPNAMQLILDECGCVDET